MQLKTAGDLRGFLADVLVGIRDGTVDANQANSISKVAAQINSSLACELQARIHLKELGVGEAGSMVIAADRDEPARIADPQPVPTIKIASVAAMPRRDGDKVWCEQCEMRVTVGQAVGCKSPHCKAKDAA